MPKLTRGASRTFLDSTFGGETPDWWRIGKDMDEFTVELNPDVSVVKNIWDETSVQDNGYEPSAEANPYHANTDDAIYPKLLDITMNRLKGDSCKTKILEVIVDDTEAETHKAWIENVVVKPISYGGDTAGFAIPFTISFDGGRKEGTVKIVNGKPEFTEGAAL
jgi:hypothetical protein